YALDSVCDADSSYGRPQLAAATLFPYTTLFRSVLHHHERRGDTEDEDVAHGTVPPLHVRHRSGPPGLERDRLRVGHGALHVGDVLGRDDRRALDLLPCFVVDDPDLDRVPTSSKGVDPDDRARD